MQHESSAIAAATSLVLFLGTLWVWIVILDMLFKGG